MGIISELLGVCSPEVPEPPSMVTSLPNIAAKLLETGQLPELNVPSIVLKKNEECHYFDKACLILIKKEKHSKRKRDGISIRIMKGVYYHTGSSTNTPLEHEIPQYIPGYLYITNQRIVFIAKTNAFEKTISALTAVSTYSDAVGLQFGEKTYNLLSPTAELFSRTINLLTKQD